MSSISGGITFQGLGSGTDFASMIKSLKQVESMQKSRMEIWKAEWQLRIDAFQEITTAMTEAKTALAEFNTMNKMLKRNVASSDEKVATATADSTIDQGLYSIDVKQLATSAIYSNKTTFTGKDAKINTSGMDQTFSYTYKGVTRTIDVSPNMTLEQFTKKINNDPKNPGVKASMIKNGSGYVFQIQGKDTGAENTLSISASDRLTAFKSADQILTLAYNGKETRFSVTNGMTAEELITLINSRTSSTGLSAERDAATGQLKFLDNGRDVTGRVGLSGGGLDKFKAGNNNVQGKPGNTTISDVASGSYYSFTYDGKEYTIALQGSSLPSGITPDATVKSFDELAAKVKDLTGGELTAEWKAQTGKFDFTSHKRTLKSTNGGSLNFSFRVGTAYKDDGSKDPDSTNKLESLSLSEGATLDDLVEAFNKAATADKFASANVSPGYTASNENGVFTIKRADETSLDKNDIKILPDGTVRYMDGNTVVFETNSNIEGLESGTLGKEITSQKNSDVAVAVASDIEGLSTAVSFSEDELKKKIIDDPNDNWYSQQAQDARFTLNDWSQEFTSSSNTLTDVVEGMTITLKSKGETNLNVVDDKEQLKENIQEVVETINTLLAKIQELTKYDEDKDVEGPSTTDNGVLNMESQLTWQKGSALTGNYGVQLLRSRLKNVTSGVGNGFTRQQSSDDTLNDLFSSLSQIGIKTITDESDPNFGLLEIDEEKLNEAIDKDIRNVAELFSADMVGGTNSENFTVVSTGTRAKAGSYKVEYKVDSNGRLEDQDKDGSPDVYINGVKASYDSTTGTFTVGDMNNAAVGVSITFPTDGLTPGDHSGADADLLTIKDGKVNQMIDQLADELRPVANGSKESAGAIPLLIDNYKTVIQNIDKKIEREEARLVTWEKRMKAKFARLDTLLSEMNNTMQANASALAQLFSGSS